jgi:hypothetical protein
MTYVAAQDTSDGLAKVIYQSNPPQKINVHSKTGFGYLDRYGSVLIDASICCAAADADTQYSICESSALKKQFPIFETSYLAASANMFNLSFISIPT